MVGAAIRGPESPGLVAGMAARLQTVDVRRGAPVGFLVGALAAALIFGMVQLANDPALFFRTFMKSMGLGSVYALIALGFVLIFKATQTVNFAQGALAATGALFVAFLVQERNVFSEGESFSVRDGHIPFTRIGNPLNSLGGPDWAYWFASVAAALFSNSESLSRLRGHHPDT